MNKELSGKIDRRSKEISVNIASKILSNDLDQDKKEILAYGITVFFKEIEKMCLLSLIFFLMGYFKAFLFAMVNFMMLRTFIGGIHRKTTIGCLIQSFLTIYLCILISKMKLLSGLMPEIIAAALIALIILFAPVVAKERAEYPKRKRFQFKIIAIFMIAIQLLMENIFPYIYANEIVSCELLMLAEFIVAVTIHNVEGKLHTMDHNS